MDINTDITAVTANPAANIGAPAGIIADALAASVLAGATAADGAI